MPDTTTELELITAEELTTIYAAIEALKEIQERAGRASWSAPSGPAEPSAAGLGRIAGVADMAGDNLHDVLIHLAVWGRALKDDENRNYVVAGAVAGDD